MEEKKPCTRCGSVTSKKYTLGYCITRAGCDARRCRRRLVEDSKRPGPWKQCACTRGTGSVKFCTLGAKHEGKHLNGSVEWDGDEAHPIAVALTSMTAREAR